MQQRTKTKKQKKTQKQKQLQVMYRYVRMIFIVKCVTITRFFIACAAL